ncbi:MAG: helix-turn-helix transcriptional regulator [Candidatus Competibacteraceae bacterium]
MSNENKRINKRALTPDEENARNRLKRIWEAKRKVLGLTQQNVADRCGWSSQSTTGHYLSGRLALNTDAVLALARVLNVNPNEIWPNLLPNLKLDDVVSPDVAHIARAIDNLPDQDRQLVLTVISRFLPSHDLSPEAVRVAQAIDALPDQDRQALLMVIDRFLAGTAKSQHDN